ncbi:MAG: 4-hydroxybenzoate polyprenyl transferase [Myxococcota bacterium]|jgi:4-hydroxybenzoate polyprenyl transferase
MNNYLKLIRADKPIGSLLLFLPCLFGVFLAAKNRNIDIIYFSSLFFIGSFLMRSAGCVINDIFDRDFDKNVNRTKNRPIASGVISVKKALIFLAVLLFLSFLILLQFNFQTIILGFVSLAFVASYPLMKRFIFYPQVFLGATFNLGILFASTAILGKITLPIFLLYLANIIWTIIYDTIYGYQDLEDDLKIGVKSTSIKFGQNPQKIFYSLAITYLFLLSLVGFLMNLEFIYFILISLAFFHLICQIKTCNFSDGADCLKKFKSNFWVGIIVLTAIIFS